MQSIRDSLGLSRSLWYGVETCISLITQRSVVQIHSPTNLKQFPFYHLKPASARRTDANLLAFRSRSKEPATPGLFRTRKHHLHYLAVCGALLIRERLRVVPGSVAGLRYWRTPSPRVCWGTYFFSACFSRCSTIWSNACGRDSQRE